MERPARTTMIVTATEIRFKSPWAYLVFLAHTMAVKRQMAAAPGLLRFELRWNRTLTAWGSEAHMRAFRNGGAHLEAMKATGRIGAAKSATWEADAFPTWAEAVRRLDAVAFRP
ncbi:MAG: hypothetical protein SF051_08805 [Elusimicrobiota bacterium]|nr:hypothetical protein [Elusimicrobiota bacterium]